MQALSGQQRGRLWPAASLRTYLIAVIVLATVPLAGLITWLMAEALNEAHQKMVDDLQRSAAAIAQTMERDQQSTIDALMILAQTESLRLHDLQAFHRTLRQIPPVRPTLRHVFLVDASGQIRLSNDRPWGEIPPYGLSQAEQRAVRDTRRALITRLARRPSDGQWSSRIAVPVIIEDVPRYFLVAEIDASTWQSLLAVNRQPPNGFITLFDQDQRIVARTRSPSKFIGQQLPEEGRRRMGEGVAGFQKTPLLEGGLTYVAWHRLPGSRWGVGVGVVANEQDTARHKPLLLAALAGVLSLLAGGLLALVVARKVSRPLRDLAEGHLAGDEPIAVKEIALLQAALVDAEQHRQQANEHLAAKATEFETLFNNTPIGLSITLDRSGRQVWRNPAKEAMLGPDGRPAMYLGGRLLTPEEHPLQRAASGETVRNLELEVRPADGTRLQVLAQAVPLLDAGGQPRGAVAAYVDITERTAAQQRLIEAERRLRESQQLVELAQEAGQVGFFDYAVFNHTVVSTSGLSRLFGQPPEQTVLTWSEWIRFMHPQDLSKVEQALNDAWKEERDHISFVIRTRPDVPPIRWLACRMVVLYGEHGQPQRVIGVMVDMTIQHAAEEQRARLIEQEQHARMEAEKANRAKDEFLAMLGHELRNPLGAISGAVEVLNRIGAQDAPAVRVRQIITRQTRHLARLMDDLLDVARVIAGKIVLSPQPVDLGQLVERLLHTLKMAGTIQNQPLVLKLAPAWVHADAVRLEQIVNNLLTNAVKYGGEGKPIEITVATQGETVSLAVRDHGEGIPASLLPHIFDIFVQGERTLDRRQGGLGIGLTLVKRLVDLHQGHIEVHSDGQGSVFTVTLPAVAPPEHVPFTPLPMVSPPRRVVIVEDNEDALEALRFMLELRGHTVWLETDGLAGQERILEVQPDLALVDLGLPTLTGFEVAAGCRSAGFGGRMVALSGYGQARDVEQARQAGFDAHLVKPIDPMALERELVLSAPPATAH